MKIDFKLIENIEIGDIDMRDYPDFTDAYIEYAEYDGKEMSEEMMDYIVMNHQDFINEYIFDNQLYLR